MDEREQNELLWRSCYLGIRVALQSLNPPDTFEKLTACIRLLDEIARNETALPEPQSNGASPDPQTKRLVLGIGNQGTIADRDLAPMIVAGLNRAATVG